VRVVLHRSERSGRLGNIGVVRVVAAVTRRSFPSSPQVQGKKNDSR
jgi:hypothetical protein